MIKEQKACCGRCTWWKRDKFLRNQGICTNDENLRTREDFVCCAFVVKDEIETEQKDFFSFVNNLFRP